MILVGEMPGAVGNSEQELKALAVEFVKILNDRGLRTENLSIDGANGDISFDAPDFPKQDAEVIQALLAYARDMEYTIKRKVHLLVSIPELRHSFAIVSDELGLG